MTSHPTDNWLLCDVQDWVHDRVEDGVRCPCCGQFAKVYERRINASMVRALVALWRRGPDWVHLPPVDPSHGEAARLSYWGLIEEEPTVREDGGRAGWWRITQKGNWWLEGRFPVQMYARIYNGRLLGFSGGPWFVQDAVRDKFDLQQLMRGQ